MLPTGNAIILDWKASDVFSQTHKGSLERTAHLVSTRMSPGWRLIARCTVGRPRYSCLQLVGPPCEEQR